MTLTTAKRALGTLVTALLLFSIYDLFSCSVDASNPTRASNSLLAFAAPPDLQSIALNNAHELDQKYLPGLVGQDTPKNSRKYLKNDYDSGNAKYTTTIVMGRLKNQTDRVQWVYNDLINVKDKQIYIVDDAHSNFPHLDRNHGREAAVYLTYITRNYYNLSDITFFWHNDRVVWHNNLMLNWDSVNTINRMNRDNIIRRGYVPSRCDHWPGCPAWIRFNPSQAENRLDPHRLENMFTPELFRRIFPESEDFPPYFAGTCCSQFAVSRDAIHSRPLETYQRLLEWVLEYQQDDQSGMVLEYTWPFIFTGVSGMCPSMHECYCNTYDFCMDDHQDVQQLESWNDLRTRREEVKWQVNFIQDTIDTKSEQARRGGRHLKKIAETIDTFRNEHQRLSGELDRLVRTTWTAREKIIHRWGLGVPPVGW